MSSVMAFICYANDETTAADNGHKSRGFVMTYCVNRAKGAVNRAGRGVGKISSFFGNHDGEKEIFRSRFHIRRYNV